ncbi:MAG TPA: AAA family ATPase [Stellaceae bacterium]|nr:AAA family ATPase [Stellaceae bacterium]
MNEDQSEAIAFLGAPSSYGPGVNRVDVVETHVSLIFLAGERAYKLKRAVAYPYLDFSTPERRRAACEAELALNRRTAPELYLDVRAVGRDEQGKLGWSCTRTACDWVVMMRRFEQSRLLASLAEAGQLDPPLILALAAHIAQFHAAAEPRRECGGAAAIAAILSGNSRSLCAAHGAGFAPAAIDDLDRLARDHLAHCAALLDKRRAAGKVRRCHGDLHLRNICLLDGEPVLFDCLEFSEELATIDVLYDLAFLVMDLEHRGLPDLANLVLNRYLDLTDEEDGLAALPLFLSLRAAIRAHVTAAALDRHTAADDKAQPRAEARHYLDAARAALLPQPIRLVALGGLSGTGKSTLAVRLAPALGLRPGARVLRSDVIRKRLFGVAPEAPLPPAAYTADVTRRVYDSIRAKAAAALAAGYCAVIDAVALLPEERAAFAAVAAAAQVPFTGLWLEAPAETMRARVGARRHDASDASEAVLTMQLGRDPGAVDWRRIPAGGDPGAVLLAARRALVAE